MLAVVGGSKVSTKLSVLHKLSELVDQLIPGGGIANTFIAAAGYEVGKSLFEPDLVADAKRLMDLARSRGGDIPIPVDVAVATEFSEAADATIKTVDAVDPGEMILDRNTPGCSDQRERLSGTDPLVFSSSNTSAQVPRPWRAP